MSTTVSMIYNICLLAVWVLFLWKNLTPRFSFRITMLICAAVVPAVALGVNYGLNRLSVLRLISIPLLFLILGLTLYRSPIPLTAFVALLPEATLLMMEMMLSVIFPMLFGLNGEVHYFSHTIRRLGLQTTLWKSEMQKKAGWMKRFFSIRKGRSARAVRQTSFLFRMINWSHRPSAAGCCRE